MDEPELGPIMMSRGFLIRPITTSRGPASCAFQRVVLLALSSALLLGVVGCGRHSADGLSARSARESQPEPTKIASALGEPADCCETADETSRDAVANAPATETVVIPDVELVDDHGKPVRLVSDLIRGRVFAVNFIFTTCRGVCPVLGANFARLGQLLRERGQSDVVLISVTVDPATDKPEVLQAWRQRIQLADGANWSLVTGQKRNLDRLLKALQVFTPDKNQHSQSVLIGDGRRLDERPGGFAAPILRLGGLPSPEQVRDSLRRFTRESAPILGAGDATNARSLAGHQTQPAATPVLSPAEEYFTKWYVPDEEGRTVKRYFDIVLTDQDGQRRRFFADLLRDRGVIVHTFFSSCTGVCPKMLATMRKLQDRLGPRLGRDVIFVSLSVDPEVDTPAKLKVLAQQFGARPGWYFLTGDPGEMEGLVRKLQPDYTGKASHSTRLFIGNLKTHTWAKPDLASYPEAKIIESAEQIWDAAPAATGP